MKETEITVEVLDTLQNVEKILEQKEYIIKERYSMLDYYFSKHELEELKNMTYKDLIKNSFLVRQVDDGEITTKLCYKNKEVDTQGAVISEEKITCKIDESKNAVKIFEVAGLTCWSKIKQDITVYKKDGKEFLLQNVDGVGVFIEYEEYEGIKALTGQQKIDVLKQELIALGLTLGSDYSCKKVYMKFKKENNLV